MATTAPTTTSTTATFFRLAFAGFVARFGFAASCDRFFVFGRRWLGRFVVRFVRGRIVLLAPLAAATAPSATTSPALPALAAAVSALRPGATGAAAAAAIPAITAVLERARTFAHGFHGLIDLDDL